MNNPKDYHLHSGGAIGSDLAWDRIGREFDIPAENMHHYRPEHYHEARSDEKLLIDSRVDYAAACLGRPSNFKGIDLVKRNWFQVNGAEAIYAIGRIIPPGGRNAKGFVNKANYAVVDGGTGWAVQMAINENKSVYVFDLAKNSWYKWALFHGADKFYECDIPALTKNFAGIGTRELNQAGEAAIYQAYIKTFKK